MQPATPARSSSQQQRETAHSSSCCAQTEVSLAMVAGGKGSHPECYFTASGVAAIINFPLWKAAAIGQSGFDKTRAAASKNFLQRYDSLGHMLFSIQHILREYYVLCFEIRSTLYTSTKARSRITKHSRRSQQQPTASKVSQSSVSGHVLL